MLGGLIPGAEAVASKDDLWGVMGKMGEYMEVTKFESCNFRALPNNDMMMNVNWQFTWKESGKVVKTTAIVRKVLNAENNICEKYHMIDCAAVLGDSSPRDVMTNEA